MSDPEARREMLKAEYDRIKSEQAQRIGFRDNMLFVHLAAVGAVASWVLTNASPPPADNPTPRAVYALLVIPWIGIILGWTYLVNDHLISRIGRYVREVLAPRAAEIGHLQSVRVTEADGARFEIAEFFGWEPFHRADHLRAGRKRVQFAVDLVTFVLPGLLAILGFLHLSGWSPGTQFAKWSLGDWLITSTIVVEGGCLVGLLYSFVAYADLRRERAGSTRLPPAAPRP